MSIISLSSQLDFHQLISEGTERFIPVDTRNDDLAFIVYTSYRMLMMEAEAARRYNLSSWRHAVAAGEPLPAVTLAAIRSHFGVTPLDGIGMSECMVYCFNRTGMPIKPGSCGQPGPGASIELLDDDLQPAPPGSEGVLFIWRASHPGMMNGSRQTAHCSVQVPTPNGIPGCTPQNSLGKNQTPGTARPGKAATCRQSDRSG